MHNFRDAVRGLVKSEHWTTQKEKFNIAARHKMWAEGVVC